MFKADFIEEFDPYESNNVADSAKAVATGEVIESAFYPSRCIPDKSSKLDVRF